jgi:hypothetical protein
MLRENQFDYNMINTVNLHPRDLKVVAVVDWWLLFKGSFMLRRLKLGLPKWWLL